MVGAALLGVKSKALLKFRQPRITTLGLDFRFTIPPGTFTEMERMQRELLRLHLLKFYNDPRRLAKLGVKGITIRDFDAPQA